MMNQAQIAIHALEAYPITSPSITFLRHNENVTFHVVDERTKHAYMLRIHSPLTTTFFGERQRPEVIEAELRWLEALTNETELTLQRPVRTKSGALVSTVTREQEHISCSLVTVA